MLLLSRYDDDNNPKQTFDMLVWMCVDFIIRFYIFVSPELNPCEKNSNQLKYMMVGKNVPEFSFDI